jgi:hypothetical protein
MSINLSILAIVTFLKKSRYLDVNLESLSTIACSPMFLYKNPFLKASA